MKLEADGRLARVVCYEEAPGGAATRPYCVELVGCYLTVRGRKDRGKAKLRGSLKEGPVGKMNRGGSDSAKGKRSSKFLSRERLPYQEKSHSKNHYKLLTKANQKLSTHESLEEQSYQTFKRMLKKGTGERR